MPRNICKYYQTSTTLVTRKFWLNVEKGGVEKTQKIKVTKPFCNKNKIYMDC